MSQLGVVGPSDAFDSAEYNPIDHLNALFATPSSLSSARSVSTALRKHQDELDRSIQRRIAQQRSSDAASVQRIQVAQSELAELFDKISSVQTRAEETERAITDMTAEIKRLDATKRNLTNSMTALKRLQMLTSAYEQLRILKASRQYRECASLLAAVLQLMAHFKSYRSIEQIAALSKGVADIQRELLEQVCEDFEIAFAKSEIQAKRGMLSEACGVMDALGDYARQRLVNWYCNTQLREYRQVFRGSEEAGSLDNIARRYSWFNRMLKTYDTEHAMLFPVHWRVNEMLANAFCEGTREDYKSILQKSMRRTDGQPPDVNLLLSCLQETLDFEHSLERRFAAGESRSSMDTISSGKDEKSHGFSQAISEAFEPYLSVWVESQDKQLASLIPRYRQQPIRNHDEEFHNQMVIGSSTELFHTYRVALAQCAKLSTGGRLLELSRTFAKYLDIYSQQVLFHLLAEKSGPQGPSLEDIVIILNTADYCYNTTTQLEERIRSRIDEDLREQIDLQSQADSFMGVASATVRTLVRKVEVDCDSAWREMRNMPWSRMDTVGDQSGYITVLIQRMRARSAEILKLIHKNQYARAFCDNLLDSLVTAFVSCIVAVRPITETGAEQMLLDSYALKKAMLDLSTLSPTSTDHESIKPAQPNPAYVKRINTTLALRLDPLLKTLQVRASPAEGLVQAYLIHIHDSSETNFRKILDLKGIRNRSDQSSLIELFNAHKASPSNTNLIPSNGLIGNLNFNTSATSQTGIATAPGLGLNALTKDATASHSSPALSSSVFSSTSTTQTGPGSFVAGGGGPSKFDPTSLGSALMSAARDGVDRFGSPSISVNTFSSTSNNNSNSMNSHANNTRDTNTGAGIAVPGDRTTSPNTDVTTGPTSSFNTGANAGTVNTAGSPGGPNGGEAIAGAGGLNENLKNFGKFFRRDVGGSFGGFGRRSMDRR